MSKQLRAVRSEDLVVGKEYYDTSNVCSASTLLRFLGRDERRHLLFDHVSGPGVYHRDRSGKIPFGGGYFHEQTEG